MLIHFHTYIDDLCIVEKPRSIWYINPESLPQTTTPETPKHHRPTPTDAGTSNTHENIYPSLASNSSNASMTTSQSSAAIYPSLTDSTCTMTASMDNPAEITVSSPASHALSHANSTSAAAPLSTPPYSIHTTASTDARGLPVCEALQCRIADTRDSRGLISAHSQDFRNIQPRPDLEYSQEVCVSFSDSGVYSDAASSTSTTATGSPFSSNNSSSSSSKASSNPRPDSLSSKPRSHLSASSDDLLTPSRVQCAEDSTPTSCSSLPNNAKLRQRNPSSDSVDSVINLIDVPMIKFVYK